MQKLQRYKQQNKPLPRKYASLESLQDLLKPSDGQPSRSSSLSELEESLVASSDAEVLPMPHLPPPPLLDVESSQSSGSDVECVLDADDEIDFSALEMCLFRKAPRKRLRAKTFDHTYIKSDAFVGDAEMESLLSGCLALEDRAPTPNQYKAAFPGKGKDAKKQKPGEFSLDACVQPYLHLPRDTATIKKVHSNAYHKAKLHARSQGHPPEKISQIARQAGCDAKARFHALLDAMVE